jgi:hypothetical protein
MVLSVPGTPVLKVEATDRLTHEDAPRPRVRRASSWCSRSSTPTVSNLTWGLTPLVDLASQSPTVKGFRFEEVVLEE